MLQLRLRGRHTGAAVTGAVACLALCCLTAPAAAQDDDSVLRVVGAAVVEVPPDHARLSVGVRIQADSPEAASTEMSRRIDAIVDALVDGAYASDYYLEGDKIDLTILGNERVNHSNASSATKTAAHVTLRSMSFSFAGSSITGAS